MAYAWQTSYSTPDGGLGGAAGWRGDICAALVTLVRSLRHMPAGARGFGEIHRDGRLRVRAERDEVGRIVWRWPWPS